MEETSYQPKKQKNEELEKILKVQALKEYNEREVEREKELKNSQANFWSLVTYVLTGLVIGFLGGRYVGHKRANANTEEPNPN